MLRLLKLYRLLRLLRFFKQLYLLVYGYIQANYYSCSVSPTLFLFSLVLRSLSFLAPVLILTFYVYPVVVELIRFILGATMNYYLIFALEILRFALQVVHLRAD